MSSGNLNSAGWKQNEEIALIRNSTHSLYARLRSIEYDARRVWYLREQIAAELPLFGNARAGSWYVPSHLAQTCCFKSADGHYGQWNVSTRRPNLRLLREAVRAGGAVVVDVTRAGKAWPDALAKTLPLWCAVVSAVALGVRCDDDEMLQGLLHLHRSVSPSEEAAIRRQLPRLLQNWLDARVDIPTLVPGFGGEKALTKLRPLWIRADADNFWDQGVPSAERLGFLPVLCVSASPPLDHGSRAFIEADPVEREDSHDTCCEDSLFPVRNVGFAYVQGAGDDEEAWCHGLTPTIFWANRCRLLQFAQTRQHLAPSDTQLGDDMRSELGKIQQSLGPTPCSEKRRAVVTDLVFKTRLRVIVSRERSIAEDCAVASRLNGCQGVLALSHSRHQEIRAEREQRPSRNSESENLIIWLDMANFRGKADFKNALCRSLRPGLSFLSSRLNSLVDERRDGFMPVNHHVTVLCDSGTGEWAAGMAIAWFASKHSRGAGRGEVGDDNAGLVGKQLLRALILKLLLEREDLTVSRNTAQQLNRFFLSPAPP